MNTDELFRARANYSIAQNTITIGYEREALNVFYLFNPRSKGVLHLRLRRGGGQRPHRLQNQTARQLVYANAFDNVKADGAAAFSNVKHKGYLPNEWWPFAGLSLKAGLRVDYYAQDDQPRANQRPKWKSDGSLAFRTPDVAPPDRYKSFLGGCGLVP